MADDQFVLKYVLAPIGGLLLLVMMLADKPFSDQLSMACHARQYDYFVLCDDGKPDHY